MNVQELIKKLNEMLKNGDIKPESEIIVGHYTTGPEGLKEDLHLWGVDWLYDELGVGDMRILEIQAYDEPIK